MIGGNAPLANEIARDSRGVFAGKPENNGYSEELFVGLTTFLRKNNPTDPTQLLHLMQAYCRWSPDSDDHAAARALHEFARAELTKPEDPLLADKLLAESLLRAALFAQARFPERFTAARVPQPVGADGAAVAAGACADDATSWQQQH